jgi:SAM-dependent methyltransferase
VLNRCPRYFPLVRFLEEHPGCSVLEVGSGSIGLAEFQDREFTGCDVDFPEPPHPRMTAVVASGQTLPFGSETFDLVVCQDTLEHLPPEGRETLVDELVRVSSRFVYLSFPRGRLARLADQAYAFYHGRIRRWPLPGWLTEHLSTPSVDPARVRGRLDACGIVRSRGNENLLAHLFLLTVEHWAGMNRRLEILVRARPRLGRLIFGVLNLPPTYRHVLMLDKKRPDAE